MDRNDLLRKTGYSDIDELLEKTAELLERGDKLKKEIEISNLFKPVNPFKTKKRRKIRRASIFSVLKLR